MFDDFHVQHDVKLLAFIGQHFGRAAAIVDLQPGLLGVDLGDIDVVLRRIDGGHFGPHAGKRFGQKARTTADIDDFDVLERLNGVGIAPNMRTDIVAQEPQTYRVEFMQRLHHTIGIPPFFSHSGKTCNFLGIGSAAGFGGGFRHGVAPKA